MKRTATILGIGLLVLLMAGSALATNPSSLKDTTWTGLLTFIVSIDGKLVTSTDNATLVFTGEDGDYLVGTINFEDTPSVSDVTFTCIKEGRALLMTAPDYLMSGFIFPGHPIKKGARPPLHMAIQGRSVANGTMFEGTLIRK